MSFSFGTPSSSGAPASNTTSSAPAAGGLLGSASGSNTPKFSFGSLSSAPAGNTATPPANTGSIFGQQQQQQQSGGDAQKPGPGLFGGAASSNAASGLSKPAGGLFDGSSSTTPAAPTGGFFASLNPANTAASTPPSAPGAFFGSAGASNTTANKPASALFGSAAAGGSSTGGGFFGSPGNAAPNQATTTTSAAPAAGLFASTGNSLFGNQKEGTSGNQTAAPASLAAATPAKPLFSLGSTTPAGAPPADSSKSTGAGTQPQTTTPASGLGMFKGGLAGGNASVGGLFAPKTAESSGTAAGGSANPPSSTAPAGSSTSLGGAGSSLFGNKAAVPATAGATPSGGLFGNSAASAAATPAAPTAAAAAGSLFGKSTTPATTTAAAPTASSTAGGLFGNTQQSASASAPKPASSLFGAPAASNASATGATTATPTASATGATTAASGAATTAATASSLFGGPKPAAEGPDKDKDGQAAKAAVQNGGASNALGASTSGPTSQIPRLKNKTMEDIVTRWASDLSKYQKEFKEQATIVSTWDRNLVDNGEKIQKLYLDTFEAERASHEIERQLVAVESQQDELEAWLDRYESEVQDMFVKQIGPGEQLAGPDQERERTYKLAEKLTQQLDEKSRDLSKMVKEINEISGTLSKGAKAEDPLSQIVRVLNGHLTQLQWIDANAAALQAKVAAAQKSSGALNSHYAGADTDAAESFYRSYMGRR